MAVYYKWIKGCSSGADLTIGAWSFLEWGSNVSQTYDALPKLYVSTGRDGNKENLGYVLTNNAAGINIEQEWSFATNSGAIKFDTMSKIKKDQFMGNWTYVPFASTQLQKIGSVTFKVPVAIENYENSDYTFQVKTLSHFFKDSVFDEKITAKGTITGLSFNATSDKRAKENIQPANYSALDLIQKLPIYTYNYKNNNETVTGIMAQDLLEMQPKELDLVSNINATGENDDYMSIKNDKLMFVLMKAIQEQQEKISYLEEELNKLKNN